MKSTITTIIALFTYVSVNAQAVCDSLVSECLETNSGNGFYLELESSSNTLIESFSTISQNSGTRDVEIYYRQGNYAGHEGDPNAWTSLGATTGFNPATALSCPLPETQIPIPVNFCMQANTRYSFYIIRTSGSGTFEYHKTVPEGDTTVSDGTLTLFSGKGTADFAPFMGSFLRDSGSFQGTINYSCGCTPSAIQENKNLFQITAYPVPSSDYINLQFSKNVSSHAVLTIYTADGKLVDTVQLTGSTCKLNTTAFTKGFYYGVLNDDHHFAGKVKFVIE